MPGKKHSSTSRMNSAARFGTGDRWKFSAVSPGLLATDLLLMLLLVLLPFVMGGREAPGHRLLITLSLLLGCVWSLHRFTTGGRLVLLSVEPLILAGVLLVWLQTAPAASDMLNQLSPEYNRLLSGWGDSQVSLPTAADAAAQPAKPVWNTASLTPIETRHGLLLLISYAIIGTVVCQRVQSDADCVRILKLVALSGVLMSAFAILQLATSNDLFFWFYRHPYTGTSELLKGAFTNRNHFAHFLALSIGPLTWWMIQERRIQVAQAASPSREGMGPAQGNHSQFGTLVNVQLLMLICATTLVLLSVLLSLSRGGMLAAGIAFVVVLVGLWRLSSIRSSLTVVIMGLGFAVIGGLFVVGQDKVEVRVDQLASGDADKMDQSQGRRTIWKADLAAIRAFPWLGTGVGSHREVYPIYMTDLADFTSHEFTHAESSYVQLALETGLLGAGLLVTGLLLILARIGFSLLRTGEAKQGEFLAAVLASLAAGTVHAAADFIWYVPAIVVTTVVLGALGLRLAGGLDPGRGIPLPRIAWLLSGAVCGVALVLVQPDLIRRTAGERFYHQYLIATFDEIRNAQSPADDIHDPGEDSEQNGDDGLQNSPLLASLSDLADQKTKNTDPGDYRQVAVDQAFREQVESAQRRMQLLIRSLKANSQQPRVQLHLAASSLNLFELLQEQSDNPLSLAQISDVVASSGFSSREQMHQWLQRAFGSSIRLPMLADRLARESLKGCPVQGAAYLTLAETAFLCDPQFAGKTPFVDSALLVRGYDPKVRFFAGSRLLMAGDVDGALSHWAAVFHSNTHFRREITRRLSHVPAAWMLNQFQPNADELRDVLEVYLSMNRLNDLPEIITAVEEAVVAEAETLPVEKQVTALMRAYDAAYRLRQLDRAEKLLEQAIALDDQAYWPRKHLGLLLYETERYAEAGEVLFWCYQHEPGDTRLDRLIREARRRSLKQDVSVVPAGYQRL